jgi:hypothetical protein
MVDIKEEYNQEEYAWYDFEVDCDDWYMDSFHFKVVAIIGLYQDDGTF